MSAKDRLTELQRQQLKPGEATRSYDDEILARHKKNIPQAKPEVRALLEQNLEKRIAAEARFRDHLPTPYQSLQDYCDWWKQNAPQMRH